MGGPAELEKFKEEYCFMLAFWVLHGREANYVVGRINKIEECGVIEAYIGYPVAISH